LIDYLVVCLGLNLLRNHRSIPQNSIIGLILCGLGLKLLLIFLIRVEVAITDGLSLPLLPTDPIATPQRKRLSITLPLS
jgi:hypothetical protein